MDDSKAKLNKRRLDVIGEGEEDQYINNTELTRTRLHTASTVQWLRTRCRNSASKRYLYYPEELRKNAEINRIFTIFDEDDSKKLDLKEFLTMMNDANIKMDQAKLQMLYNIVDKDQDNALNLQEFKDCTLSEDSNKMFTQIMKEIRNKELKNRRDGSDKDSAFLPLNFSSLLTYLIYNTKRDKIYSALNNEKVSTKEKMGKFNELMNLYSPKASNLSSPQHNIPHIKPATRNNNIEIDAAKTKTPDNEIAVDEDQYLSLSFLEEHARDGDSDQKSDLPIKFKNILRGQAIKETSAVKELKKELEEISLKAKLSGMIELHQETQRKKKFTSSSSRYVLNSFRSVKSVLSSPNSSKSHSFYFHDKIQKGPAQEEIQNISHSKDKENRSTVSIQKEKTPSMLKRYSSPTLDAIDSHIIIKDQSDKTTHTPFQTPTYHFPRTSQQTTRLKHTLIASDKLSHRSTQHSYMKNNSYYKNEIISLDHKQNMTTTFETDATGINTNDTNGEAIREYSGLEKGSFIPTNLMTSLRRSSQDEFRSQKNLTLTGGFWSHREEAAEPRSFAQNNSSMKPYNGDELAKKTFFQQLQPLQHHTAQYTYRTTQKPINERKLNDSKSMNDAYKIHKLDSEQDNMKANRNNKIDYHRKIVGKPVQLSFSPTVISSTILPAAYSKNLIVEEQNQIKNAQASKPVASPTKTIKLSVFSSTTNSAFEVNTSKVAPLPSFLKRRSMLKKI